MCYRCDYSSLLRSRNLDYTPKRYKVLEIVGNSAHPLSAQEIFETLRRTEEVNRVTVYRILELLVDRRLVDRISAGDRSFRYGISPNKNHLPHPHFSCTSCGDMECLSPESLLLDTEPLERTFPGQIERIEIRIEGTCKTCMKGRRGRA